MKASRWNIALCLAAGLLLAGGCAANKNKECAGDGACCKAVKAGTITTANKVCVMVNGDPVNPEVTPVEFRGQKFGLCCEGCRSKWNSLTDAQKEEATARAVAKSK